MKKVILLTTLALLAAGTASAQHDHGHGHCGNCPHHQQHQQQQAAAGLTPERAMARAFPDMKSTQKKDQWTAVYDKDSKLLGYAVSSKPASDGIRGYAGETPVMVAFDAKKKIKGVYLLQNQETPGYVRRVEQTDFFDQWNGLTAKKALKKKVDTVSGATFTSRSVVQSVQAVLATL